MGAELIVFPFEEEARRGRQMFEDGVVRWAATDIARWAGAVRPNEVKTVVDEHVEEFEGFGNLLALPVNSGQRGRPGEEYWLNFEQALLLCVFLRSTRAADVRRVLIRITKEVVEGRFIPAMSDAHSLLVSMAEIHQQNAVLLQKMDERQGRVETDLAVLKQQTQLTYMTALEALELARRTAARLPTQRRGADMTTAAICKEINWRMFEGRCPRCFGPIIERQSDGTLRCLPAAHLHHQFGRDRNHATEMCYLCAGCNQVLEDPLERGQFSPTFSAIQIVVRAFMGRNQQRTLFEQLAS